MPAIPTPVTERIVNDCGKIKNVIVFVIEKLDCIGLYILQNFYCNVINTQKTKNGLLYIFTGWGTKIKDFLIQKHIFDKICKAGYRDPLL